MNGDGSGFPARSITSGYLDTAANANTNTYAGGGLQIFRGEVNDTTNPVAYLGSSMTFQYQVNAAMRQYLADERFSLAVILDLPAGTHKFWGTRTWASPGVANGYSHNITFNRHTMTTTQLYLRELV